jgi:hypothetical protein
MTNLTPEALWCKTWLISRGLPSSCIHLAKEAYRHFLLEQPPVPEGFDSEVMFDVWDSITTVALNESHQEVISQWTDENGVGQVTLSHHDLIRLVRHVAHSAVKIV